ncbi:MAG TPA: ABC transporter ATP-binding protein [Terriglobales bacterium]|nr:ABC transporter ATP-binding protein [Terriglobales bacterium]
MPCFIEQAVSLRRISRAFGPVPAVSRVSLEVARGEVVLLRGPNGAGKSTLLRIVATALSPTSGSGRVLGFDLLDGREEIRRRIELIGHRTRLYEDLTAIQNLRFAALLYGADPALAAAALEEVGLGSAARERVRGFSQGMRQRVALARAHLRSPELLLLDEPYAGLDRDAGELVDAMVTAARTEGRTVLLVTHDASRAGLASRVVVMRAGHLHGATPAAETAAVRA